MLHKKGDQICPFVLPDVDTKITTRIKSQDYCDGGLKIISTEAFTCITALKTIR